MATQEERRAATRRSLLKAASEGFRANGFAGIGVDGISKEAGATSGAFYAHLGSKQAAFEEALEMGLDEVLEAIPRFQEEYGDGWVREFVRYYLGAAHRGDLACCCAMTSLSPEVARSDASVKQRYSEKMRRIISAIADGVEGGELSEREESAWSFVALLVGGVTLCRALGSGSAVDGVADGIARAAEAVLLGGD